MSYDIAIIAAPIPADDAEAWSILSSLINHAGTAPPVFRMLHDRLVERYPCISSLPDDEIDEGVWSNGPLWNNFGHRAAVLAISYSRVEEVLPFVVQSATTLGLAVFDWSARQISRADGFKGLTLTVEEQHPLAAPTLNQLNSAVDALMPASGPGFLILEGPTNSYAQAAGGDGVYTAEWREYVDQQFKHWVAGIPARPSKNEVAIPMKGFQVTVKENERLNAAEVKRILAAFAKGGGRPAEYAWREISERFA